jgi:hypothetical protein
MQCSGVKIWRRIMRAQTREPVSSWVNDNPPPQLYLNGKFTWLFISGLFSLNALANLLSPFEIF